MYEFFFHVSCPLRVATASNDPRTCIRVRLLCPAPRVGALSDDARLTSVLSVAYIGPKSKTERSRKTKIGPRHTRLGHHFQCQKVKGQLAGAGSLLIVAITEHIMHNEKHAEYNKHG